MSILLYNASIESLPEKHQPQPPRTWNELLGPFIRANGLSDKIRETSGLIVLVSEQGTEVCPDFQFERDEAGEWRVNPHVAFAWSLISSMQRAQEGRSDWAEAGWLAKPREEYGDRTWVDVLKDESVTDQQKLGIYAEIIWDAVDGAWKSGIDLVDPRTVLPE